MVEMSAPQDLHSIPKYRWQWQWQWQAPERNNRRLIKNLQCLNNSLPFLFKSSVLF
jgi:hypothetical protein